MDRGEGQPSPLSFLRWIVGQTEVDANCLGVADVEVAVGLGRKAGLDDGVAELFGAHILGDHVAEEVGGSGGGWAFRIRVGHS